MLELILGILLAAGATYFVLRPILRPPLESAGSEPAGDEGEDPADDMSPQTVALRALRLGTRRRCPLLQPLWSPRRRLTLAFSSPVSYQSASLNSGARREPMGFAGAGGAVADRVDGLHRGCAAPHSPPRDRQFRPLVWRTPRLQLRRG